MKEGWSEAVPWMTCMPCGRRMSNCSWMGYSEGLDTLDELLSVACPQLEEGSAASASRSPVDTATVGISLLDPAAQKGTPVFPTPIAQSFFQNIDGVSKTLLAPTDAAFARLSATNATFLAEHLSYHLLSGTFTADIFLPGMHPHYIRLLRSYDVIEHSSRSHHRSNLPCRPSGRSS